MTLKAEPKDKAHEAAVRGDFAAALQALVEGAGLRLARGPDFKVRERDPRQDLQYGGSLRLCAGAASYRLARRALRRLRRRKPESWSLLLLSGIVDTFLGEFASAGAFFDSAISMGPESWGYAWRGLCRAMNARRLKTQDGLRKALEDLDRAVELGPARLFALPWRAELRHDLEDLPGALGDLEEVLAQGHGGPWERVERGEILCEIGRHGEALAEFERLVREHPRCAWAYALRGRTLATTGREEDSLADLEKSLQLEPRSAAAHAWLSESLRKLGRYREAHERLDRALRLDPRFVLAWVWRGRLRLLLGRLPQARRDLDRAVRLDPRYRLAFAWRGEVLFKLGRSRAAARDFDRIAPMDPARTWNPVLSEGERLTAGARERAFRDGLRRALEKSPSDPLARRLSAQAASHPEAAREALPV